MLVVLVPGLDDLFQEVHLLERKPVYVLDFVFILDVGEVLVDKGGLGVSEERGLLFVEVVEKGIASLVASVQAVALFSVQVAEELVEVGGYFGALEVVGEVDGLATRAAIGAASHGVAGSQPCRSDDQGNKIGRTARGLLVECDILR
jgi:hypothetical protein